MKKVFLNLLLVATTLIATTSSICAAEPLSVETSTDASVPMYLTAETTAIDFTINEKIDVEIESGRSALDVNQLVIKNVGVMGQLSIDGLKVVVEDGWTIVADTTDFVNMEKNAKKFSLKFGTYDLSTDQTFTHGTYLVENGKTYGMSLSGSLGIQTVAIDNQKFASIVVTVAVY